MTTDTELKAAIRYAKRKLGSNGPMLTGIVHGFRADYLTELVIAAEKEFERRNAR